MPSIESEQDLWFRQQLLPHAEKLGAWLRKRFPHRQDIDDIVQDSFLKTLLAHQKKKVRAPKSFLFATARNQAINASKKAKLRGEHNVVKIEDLDVLDTDSDVFKVVSRNQELELLEQAIESLPLRCRKIFTLRKTHGLTQKEIARKLGLSVNTVYAQLSIGFHKCAEYVERYQRETRT